MHNNYMRFGSKLILIVALSFLACTLFVIVRFGLTGKFSNGYLVWNLILAAFPVFIAWLTSVFFANKALKTEAKTKINKAIGLGLLGLWLIFYPNAPYLFTDFIHVVRRSGLGALAATWMSKADLLWYDIVMNSAFAFVGHFLGLVSMYIVHSNMTYLFGKVTGWILLVPAILLSGFGIHMGRFGRFNSWDILIAPKQAFYAMISSIQEPSAMLFSFAFALFIALTYIIFYLWTNIKVE